MGVDAGAALFGCGVVCMPSCPAGIFMPLMGAGAALVLGADFDGACPALFTAVDLVPAFFGAVFFLGSGFAGIGIFMPAIG